MPFDFALISTFLFASAVLADLEFCSTQFLDVVEKGTSATSDSVQVVVSNLAGAALEPSTPTFHNITGTIAVPYVWGSDDSEVGIWVGLDDGDSGTFCGAVFAAGFICTVTSNGPSYTAAAYSYPHSPVIKFANFEVSYEDRVRVTISIFNQTTGVVTFENLGEGPDKPKPIFIILPFCSQAQFCQQRAWWIVEKMEGHDLAHFGTVPIAHPVAYGQEQDNGQDKDNKEYSTENISSVYEITSKDGLPLTWTKVETDGDLIRVTEK